MSAADFTAIYDALVAQHGIKSASDMAIARTLARLMTEDGGDAVKQAEGIARLRALLPTPPQSEVRAYVEVVYVGSEPAPEREPSAVGVTDALAPAVAALASPEPRLAAKVPRAEPEVLLRGEGLQSRRGSTAV